MLLLLSLANRRVRWRALGVALVAAIGYAAVSGPLLLHPSPHFHFVDMAQSFLHGRLDTDTPRRSAGMASRPDDPRGLQEAVDRHLRGAGGQNNGWNDWASYRVLTLKGGETVRGVFPWKDTPGARQHEFYTLDGRLMIIDPDKDLRRGCDAKRPGAACDETVYQISFPPFPAVVMLPLTALFGYKVNDVLVTLAFAVASAVLLLLWLERLARQGLLGMPERDRLWIVALLAFGTVAFYCSVRGEVWFTALTIGMTLHLAYLMAAQGARRPLLAGLFLGLGVATRTPLLFAGIFLPLEAFFPEGRWLGGRGKAELLPVLRKLVLFGLPLIVIGAILAWFNQARWQNPLEFGHFYLLEGTRAPTRENGLFSFVFLNHNLGTAILNMPRLLAEPPFFLVSRHGLGILACTPAFFLLLRRPPPSDLDQLVSPEQDQARRGLMRNLGWTVAAVALPGLFYQNDGWQQFGYRFAMDFLPALMGLYALRLPHLTRGAKVLILLSIAVQLFGAVTFGRMDQFYYD